MELVQVKTQTRRGRQKPHKFLMLLAVTDTFESSLVKQNRIEFDEELINSFKNYFALYADESDLCQPSMPYFHLRSSKFWFHQVRSGREEIYNTIKSSGGGTKRITDNIDYVYFSEDVYELFIDSHQRQKIKAVLIALLKMR